MIRSLILLSFLTISCGAPTGDDTQSSSAKIEQSPITVPATQNNLQPAIGNTEAPKPATENPILISPVKPPVPRLLVEPSSNTVNNNNPLQSSTRYYVTMFGTESAMISFPVASHTWSTFAAIRNGRIAEELTISWLPAPGHFRRNNTVPRLGIVPGKNYTLDETAALYPKHKYIAHGAFEITAELFDRAKKRIAYLNSGTIRYKALILSENDRDLSVKNLPNANVECIHAVSDIAGKVRTGLDYGNYATRDVIEHFAEQGFIISDLRRPILEILSMMKLPKRLPDFKVEIINY